MWSFKAGKSTPDDKGQNSGSTGGYQLERWQDRAVQGTKKKILYLFRTCLLKLYAWKLCTLLYVDYTYIRMKAK